jgi:hypothetical protein
MAINKTMVRALIWTVLFCLCGLSLYLLPKEANLIKETVEFLDKNVFFGRLQDWFYPF